MISSKFLNSNKQLCIDLIDELSKNYKYVSILANDVKGTVIKVNKMSSSIGENDFDKQQGFVVKLSNGGAFFEYSFDNFDSDVKEFAKKIIDSVDVSDELKNKEISDITFDEEELIKDFERDSDFDKYSNEELLNFCKINVEHTLGSDKHFVNAIVNITTRDESKMFISKKRQLTQHFTWVNGFIVGVYVSDQGKMVQSRVGSYSNLVKDVIDDLPSKIDELVYKSEHLAKAKPITPGVYDIITDPSITGLIAHEAFGHGVEMDQFVKDRALAKYMVGEYVASPICNMRDGAKDILSAASYFFDDDGVLATNTQIIKDGILVSGICDFTSAKELGVKPSGNSRREKYNRKAYTRMTNTYFEKGKDKLEDMISSIKHGYMLFETNNGMEDPKNWAIQCVCEYGIEIVDGKLTDNWVSPVVMSGFVPDLLKSISAVSDEFKIIGSGSCGKGYKEWVRVSDGGPHLKAKVKLS